MDSDKLKVFVVVVFPFAEHLGRFRYTHSWRELKNLKFRDAEGRMRRGKMQMWGEPEVAQCAAGFGTGGMW